jgi:hypothetical protein
MDISVISCVIFLRKFVPSHSVINLHLQAFFVDLYADACELVKKQSVHVWMLRFKDAPTEVVARGCNVVEVLVNEGGRTEPKCMEACFTLILEWLIALGPDSGVHCQHQC